MTRLRHIGLCLWLALAVFAGQQAVVLHDLRHAIVDPAGTKHHAPAKCDEHFACAQLASAVGSAPSTVGVIASRPPFLPALPARGIVLAPRFAFQSRAPPVLSA